MQGNKNNTVFFGTTSNVRHLYGTVLTGPVW